MKTFKIFILLTIFSFSETYISNSIIINSTINDGNFQNNSSAVLSSKNIPTSFFNKIEIDSPADITINQAQKREVVLEMESSLMNKVKIYVQKETLFIRTRGNFNSNTGIKISINNPRLSSLIVNGASTIRINGYNEKKFSLVVDGSSDIYFSSGNFNNFSINADGSFDINLLNVNIKKTKIRAGGAGDIQVNVSDYLNVELEGSVDVKYLGSPKIKKIINNVSDLTRI
ncbi:MAG: DUF2807 domain-containing protein [Sulfurovaceae bacterium]|nr:DUF2807 domain-containing protein [Sulfurovaceae bacterium]